MFRLINPIRRYDWGSTSLIQDLCGLERDGRPAAEMWIGAHPDDPSRVRLGGQELGLDAVIAQDPERMLGTRVTADFGLELPFLMKFLAAEHPLSLQVHPTVEQAEKGFTAEEVAGVPHDAPERNYRDHMHKPELVYALTPFDLMTGLRPPAESARLLAALNVPQLERFLVVLTDESLDDPHREVFRRLLADRGSAPDWIGRTAAAAGEFDAQEYPQYALMVNLARLFPGDPGMLAPLLLNLERLAVGEAIFTPARGLHSYVRGLGVEVMASSDNVLRAGLTSKVVDGPELLNVANFSPAPAARLAIQEHSYLPPVPEFVLTVIDVSPGEPADAPSSGPRLAACIRGEVILRTSDDEMVLTRGESAFVADDEGSVTIIGNGSALVAHV